MQDEEAVTNRIPREAETHDKTARRKPWKPVRKLETPPPPPGWNYRWIRAEYLGKEDSSNVSRRLREGFELVMGTELTPEWQYMPTVTEGRHAGVVHNEGLLLAKIPTETVEERTAYYQRKNQHALTALDNSIFKDAQSDSRYVKYDPRRDSKVTFGKS